MNIKEALRKRQLTIGSWIQIGHPAVAEILCNYYDWLAIDLEHTDISLEQVTNLFRAMGDAVPLVRVSENNTLAIRKVLDAGARGVIVPLVNTREEAERAIKAARYAPEGVRGHCFARMNNYGGGFDSYLHRANEEISVVVMIESREAVDNVYDIAMSGVDGVFIGPYDLSGSYGIPGQTTHPLILKARQRVVDACKCTGIAAGIHVVNPDEQIKKTIEEGFTFIAVGGDTMFLHKIASQFSSKECR